MRIIITLIALFSLAGCNVAKLESEEGAESAVTEVTAVKAEVLTLQPSLNLSGVLISIPENNALVTTPVAGQVGALLAHAGQIVKAGETLATLDTRLAESELSRAKAALREVSATLALLKHGPLPEEIEAARQDARSAAENAQALSAKLTALAPLHERAEISEVQFAQAQSSLAGATSASEAASQRLKLLQDGTRPESIEEAAARVSAAEAELDAKELALQFTQLQSPIDGVVTDLAVRMGMIVDPAFVVARITNLSTLFVQARIPAQFRRQIQEGARASVKMLDAKDGAIDGVISRIGAEADPQTGDVDAFISIENLDLFLRPGLACAVQLHLPEVRDALVIPISAIANHDGKSVVTLIRDERAHEAEVETGVATGGLVQILSGIEVGDVVATTGGYALPDDSPVHATLQGGES